MWRDQMAKQLDDIPRNVRDICHYGFTEMFNNVIEHSGGKTAICTLIIDALQITMRVQDDGIGIFRNIREKLRLVDDRQAILELSKGKLTTDPERHSGEGIFFTSRMFDFYAILSDRLFFCHHIGRDDWLIEDKRTIYEGTGITMKIPSYSGVRLRKSFPSLPKNMKTMASRAPMCQSCWLNTAKNILYHGPRPVVY